MNAVTPFQFDNHEVRVQVDEQGQPWFNASDVCAALEIESARDAISKHVDSDDVAKRDIIDNLGRTQQSNFINEFGLYALIFGSAEEAAKRSKRGITSEVLPAIRKTGGYNVQQETVSALPGPTRDKVETILSIGEFIMKTPEVKPGIAQAATLDCIRVNTGMETESLRLTLPTLQETK